MPWKKGDVPNPRGAPRKGTSLAERVREIVWDDPETADRMIGIAVAIAEGQPMVRIVDPATGMPRTERVKPKRPNACKQDEHEALTRPEPASVLRGGERIHEIHYPSTAETLAALTWLRESGGMKPPKDEDHVDLGVLGADQDLSRLTPAELEAYVAMLDKMAGHDDEKATLAKPEALALVEKNDAE